MAMPLSGTFDYVGIVPDETARTRGTWEVHDAGWTPTAFPIAADCPPEEREMLERIVQSDIFLNRLVGFNPKVRIASKNKRHGRHRPADAQVDAHNQILVLTASGREQATVQSVGIDLDPSLLGSFETGDVFRVARTNMAGVGVCLHRRDQLLWAVGAVTAFPLGSGVQVRTGHADDGERSVAAMLRRYRAERSGWVDVSHAGETGRLRFQEEAVVGSYQVAVLRCYEGNMDDCHESVAVSRADTDLHEACVKSATLLARTNAGLVLRTWEGRVLR